MGAQEPVPVVAAAAPAPAPAPAPAVPEAQPASSEKSGTPSSVSADTVVASGDAPRTVAVPEERLLLLLWPVDVAEGDTGDVNDDVIASCVTAATTSLD